MIKHFTFAKIMETELRKNGATNATPVALLLVWVQNWILITVDRIIIEEDSFLWWLKDRTRFTFTDRATLNMESDNRLGKMSSSRKDLLPTRVDTQKNLISLSDNRLGEITYIIAGFRQLCLIFILIHIGSYSYWKSTQSNSQSCQTIRDLKIKTFLEMYFS